MPATMAADKLALPACAGGVGSAASAAPSAADAAACAPASGSPPAVDTSAALADNSASWQVRTGGRFVAFPSQAQAVLEAAFARGDASALIETGDSAATRRVCFGFVPPWRTMRQEAPDDAEQWRPVRRVAADGSVSDPLPPPSTAPPPSEEPLHGALPAAASHVVDLDDSDEEPPEAIPELRRPDPNPKPHPKQRAPPPSSAASAAVAAAASSAALASSSSSSSSAAPNELEQLMAVRRQQAERHAAQLGARAGAQEQQGEARRATEAPGSERLASLQLCSYNVRARAHPRRSPAAMQLTDPDPPPFLPTPAADLV